MAAVANYMTTFFKKNQGCWNQGAKSEDFEMQSRLHECWCLMQMTMSIK